MKFLFLSRYGEILPTAKRVEEEGHEVVVYIHKPENRHLWDGMIPKTRTWREALTRETVVVFDETGLGALADRLRDAGYRVFGGSVFADRLEQDRPWALEQVVKRGLHGPETHVFAPGAWEEAMARVEHSPHPWVFKATGDVEPPPGVGTFTSDCPEELVGVLRHYQRVCGDLPLAFELQRLTKGIEVSTEVWLDAEGISGPVNHTWEEKRHLTGNLGDMTGCEGNVVRAYDHTRLADELFGPLVDWLLEEHYVGPLDINAIVTTEGPLFLEFTPRLGYWAWETLMHDLTQDVAEVLDHFAWGARHPPVGGLQCWGRPTLGVLLSTPPYPADAREAAHEVGLPVIVPRQTGDTRVLYHDVQEMDGELVTGGTDSAILVVTAAGATIKDAQGQVYGLLEQIHVPAQQYRTDIGDRVGRDQAYLEGGGWLPD